MKKQNNFWLQFIMWLIILISVYHTIKMDRSRQRYSDLAEELDTRAIEYSQRSNEYKKLKKSFIKSQCDSVFKLTD